MTSSFPHPPSSAEHAVHPPFPPHHQHQARLPPPPPRPSPRPRSHSFPGSDHGVIERDILLHILYGRGYGPHLRGLRERAGMRDGGHPRGMRGGRGGRFGGPGPQRGSPREFMASMESAGGERHVHRRHNQARGGHHAHGSMRHPPPGDVFGVEHGGFHTRGHLESSNQPRHHHRSYLNGDRHGPFLAGEDRHEPRSSFSEPDEECGDYVRVSTSPSVSDEEEQEAPRGHKRATVAEKKADMDAIAEQLANMMQPEEGKEAKQGTDRHHKLHRGPRLHQHHPFGGADNHHPSHRAHPPHPPRFQPHHRHSDEHHTHPGTHKLHGHPPPPPPPPHHHHHPQQQHTGPIRNSHPILGKVHTSRHHHPHHYTDDHEHTCHMGGGRRHAEHLGKWPGRSMHPGDKENFDIPRMGPDPNHSHRCRRGRSHQVRFGLQ